MVKKIIKWTAGLFLCFVTVYIIWVFVAMNRTATIAVDYVAKVNEVASAIPEDERAWPFYREVGIALRNNEEPSSIFYDNDIEQPTWPDEEGWEYLANWLESHADTLQKTHIATSKDGFGFLISGRVREEDKELWPDEFASQGEEAHDGFMTSVLLPQLGFMRSTVRLLSIDAKDAAFRGDTARCLQDIESMLQIGSHVREHPLLMSDLVSLAIYNITLETIGKIVEHEPALFSNEQFAALELSLRSIEGNLTIRFDGERYYMYDLLQRVYTDDGNGDGRIVPFDATRLIPFLESVPVESSGYLFPPASLAPFADIFFSSRKEMRDEYDRRMDVSEELRGIPLYMLKTMPAALSEQYSAPKSVLDPYFLVNLLTPALGRAVLQGEYTRAKRDAILAVLYAVQEHNKTGEWPSDLVSAGVIDAWNNEPLHISIRNGEPIIYSVGCNQEDYGGIVNKQAGKWGGSSTGDWVVWPISE
ncbi:MAG: hypothetical protein HOC27_08860 [Phycisphaerae bacterium]|nr:hypothetical protein [Phycisphaerae bacterium]